MPDQNIHVTTKPSKLGRPKQMTESERRCKIIKVAEQEFLTYGFTATTIERISVSCGMSKKSIYLHFPNKMAIFEAVLEALPSLTYPKAPDALDQVQEWVKALLLSFVSHVLSDKQVAFTRLIISEALSSPEVANAFHRTHIEPARRVLIAAFSSLETKGILPNISPIILAEILVGSALGPQHLHYLVYRDALRKQDLEDIRDRISIIVRALWSNE